MFVCVVGSVEQNIFRLEPTGDPAGYLSRLQASNPYKLSVLSKLCVQNQNEAKMMVGLGRKELGDYEGGGGWLVSLPAGLSAPLVSGHYLRSLANRAGVQPMDKNEQTVSPGLDDLRHLSAGAKRRGLTFQEILSRVEQAYEQGKSIDEILYLNLVH